jgi:hypothetical protein
VRAPYSDAPIPYSSSANAAATRNGPAATIAQEPRFAVNFDGHFVISVLRSPT